MPDLGIAEMLAGSMLADAVGTTAATGLVEAGIGAGVGAIEGGVTGGDVGKDALLGGITGGAIGAGPGFSSALDLSPMVGTALTGAAGGALAQGVTGGNPLTGAAMGGIAGGLSGALSGTSGTTGTAAGGAGGVTAAPPGMAPSGVDVTADSSFLSGGSTGGTTGATGGAGSSGVSSAAASNFTNASAGGSFGGLDTSGGAPTGPNGWFVSGSSAPTGGPNIGQGPTVENAANLTAPPPTGNSIVNAFKDPSVSSIGTALSNNAGTLTSLAGLGTDIAGGMKTPKGQSQLLNDAGSLDTLAKQNESYLSTGTLPAGAQAGIDQATQSAIAAIKSRYAGMGMSGSSSEQSEIAAVQAKAQAQGTNIAMQLMQQGASETGMADQIYQNIMSDSMKNDQAFSSAFTNLAGAVGGGGGGTTLNLKLPG